MIKRIELKNFMSHEHTVIEPAAGLTVLIGPNNVGKSAIIAALQILCYNDNSTYVMRHGAKECSVKVETDDGHSVEWKRRKSPGYLIDGQKFDRLARSGVPDELHQVLRLGKVDEFDVHFGSQKTPIFLLDQSGATAARFFASSSDAIRLVAMQQRHKEKVRDARKERNRLDQEARQLNSELAALDPVVEIERQVEELEESYQALAQLETQRDDLTATEHNLRVQLQSVLEIAGENSILQGLQAPPELDSTLPLAGVIQNILRSEGQLEIEQQRLAVTEPLTSPPALSETLSFSRLVHDLGLLNPLYNALTRENQTLKTLTSPPSLENTAELVTLLRTLEEIKHITRCEAKQTAALRSLAPQPDLTNTQPLESLLSELQLKNASYAELFAEVNRLHQLEPLEVPETLQLERTVSDLEFSLESVRNHQAAYHILEALSAPVAVLATESIELLRQQLTEQAEAVQHLQLETVTCEAARLELAAQIRQLAQEQNCPVCGGPLDAEHLLEHAGREFP